MTFNVDPSCADDIERGAVTTEDARRRIRSAVTPLAGVERLHLRAALGRVLAEELRSPLSVPGHTNSAVDGYALAGVDLPASGTRELTVAGTAFAGHPFEGELGAGQCVQITTGAVVPRGADTVVMQEQVEHVSGECIRIDDRHEPGQNVRRAGEDIERDEVVAARGHRLQAADLGVLASLGVAEVSVTRRPRVAFFSTGDELRSLGEPLADGEIYDSNRYTLYGMLSRLGVDVLDLGVVKDTPDATLDAFRRACADADVVITSGGVSVGEADYIKQALDQLGRMEFWKVAMKPGRPMTFGRINEAWFFGLPGNPVAVMTTFYVFVHPALRCLAGEVNVDPLTLSASCESKLRKKPGRSEYQRGILAAAPDGSLTVRKAGPQGSGILTSMSQSNCFIVLPDDQGPVEPGTTVSVIPFSGFLV